MEQARHWMWTKRRHALSSNHLHASINPSYDDSWEEQAFAEDAASGSLGGCVWPPRSYSCSFCRREFRSAQALGGHMNVHRRDRARLKQSPTSPHNQNLRHDNTQYHHHHQNHNIQNHFTSLGFQYPSQLCTVVYNPNPNSDPCNLASPSSPSGVSVPPADQENLQMSVTPFSSSIVPENHKRSRISSHHISDPNEGENNSDIPGSQCRAKGEYVKSDLSVSLNLVVCRSRPSVSDVKEEIISCKRRRTDATPLPFFLKQSPSSLEELDLELRLGDRPKVK